MTAKFELEIREDGRIEGGSTIAGMEFVETMAFLGTAIVRAMQDADKIAKDAGLMEEHAAGLVLELVKGALEKYAEDTGKETMQKAYEINSKVGEARG